MTRRDRRSRPVPPPRVVTETRLSPAWAWGQAVALIWYLGGFMALLVGAVMQVGPSAWVAAWQHRYLGSDSATIGFLPGFGLLLLPLLVARCLPRRTDRPFLCGVQDALWPRTRPPGPVRPRDGQLVRLRRTRGIMAGLALGCVVAAAIGGVLSMRPGDQRPGSPLPRLTKAELAAPDAVLPGYAHLLDVVARPELAWEHDYTIRATRYRDTYIPLTTPGWRPGDAVAVLQLDRRGLAGVPGPAEGSLSRGVPGWQITAMRQSGIPVGDDPLVLTREVLNGVVPEPDGVGLLLVVAFGGGTAMTFGAIALGFHRAYRRLLGQGGDA